MDTHIKNYLKLSIFLLIISAFLLALPTLIFPECTSVFGGGGCRPNMSQNMISLFSYVCGIVLGIIGAIYLKKYNDLMDEKEKSIKN